MSNYIMIEGLILKALQENNYSCFKSPIGWRVEFPKDGKNPKIIARKRHNDFDIFLKQSFRFEKFLFRTDENLYTVLNQIVLNEREEKLNISRKIQKEKEHNEDFRIMVLMKDRM